MVFDVTFDVLGVFLYVFLQIRKSISHRKVSLLIISEYFIVLKLLYLIHQTSIDQLVCSRHF